jgi:2-polyprenyl-3-methyl-5-hydroxy-6-metoxy-1,4-benzoquinol methylase
MRCRICGNVDQNHPYRVREMMLGLGEEFDYFQCSACGCLQIGEIPADMSRYYPPSYFGQATSAQAARSPIPHWAYTMFDMLEIRQALAAQRGAEGAAPPVDPAQTLARRALARYLPGLTAQPDLRSRSLRILDVGCGDGSFLAALAALGFTHLLGVDRYIDPAIAHDNRVAAPSSSSTQGVEVRRGTIEEIEPAWELIMFHHAFEHMAEPLATLQEVARLLAPGGLCLIRIPVVPCAAWERYGVDWVQLDAPRHFFLHSVQSLTLAAQGAGFQIRHYFCDSTAFQFAGSELYRRNIPLRAARPERIFTPAELRAFSAEAARLNQAGQGDQAAFYLVKPQEERESGVGSRE